jgi:hypothetical protein
MRGPHEVSSAHPFGGRGPGSRFGIDMAPETTFRHSRSEIARVTGPVRRGSGTNQVNGGRLPGVTGHIEEER